MQKPTCRVIPRKNGHAFDVEMTAPNSPPRLVNCFNKEADAWQWLDEQQEVDSLHGRKSGIRKGKAGREPDVGLAHRGPLHPAGEGQRPGAGRLAALSSSSPR